MPQLFQVLKCYKCSVFQVHQTKKSNKWECKLCGEKQSIKRHYGLGTGKECRLHVQKLNGIRGEIDEYSESIEMKQNSDDEPIIELNALETSKTSNKSKWSHFVDEMQLPKPELNESMYLGNTQVVLEMPIKKRKKFNPPSSSVEPLLCLPNDLIYNSESNEPTYRQRNLCKPDKSTSHCKTFFKTNSSNVHPKVSNLLLPVNENSIPCPETKLNYAASEKSSEKLTISENHTKTYIPPRVDKNSKWADFADESDENASTISGENSFGNTFSSQNNLAKNIYQRKACSEKVNDNLFTLCDDSELDDVLDL